MKKLTAALATVAAALSPVGASSTEIPDYSVESRFGPIEVRSYPSMLLAEVTVSGSRQQASSRAFNKLGGFIFGNNTTRAKIDMTAPVAQRPASQKIDMTAPVVQAATSDNRWVVNFMMPSEFTMDTLPVPNDSTIRIFESEPYRSVSIRFPGYANQDSLDWHKSQLLEYVKDEKIEIAGEAEYAFYDAPYVPGQYRRNEIHFRLSD